MAVLVLVDDHETLASTIEKTLLGLPDRKFLKQRVEYFSVDRIVERYS